MIRNGSRVQWKQDKGGTCSGTVTGNVQGTYNESTTWYFITPDKECRDRAFHTEREKSVGYVCRSEEFHRLVLIA